MGELIYDALIGLDTVLYYPILIIILAAAGIFFSIRTKGVQLRLFPHACKLIMEKPESSDNTEKPVSSFQALMVSTASRVGTGNIIGVSTAICLGGPGSAFWMWLMCIIGAASAFAESTLAQIYKQKDEQGGCYGGPAYYIEKALGARWAAILFTIFLILTYGFGFNMLCSFNLQSSFAVYDFYQEYEKIVPVIIGAVIAILVAYCLFGGGQRIVKMTSTIVPIMGVAYVIITLIVILAHITSIPAMFVEIFRDAFNFKAIFGGMAGSCMIYGFKRGLYSNEAGVGSAPNASASANVSHPVKQGLVQTVSVYIDTMLLCTATAFMCLSSGTARSADVAGAQYVQNATATVFGAAGPTIITIAMVLFAFTTLLGNLYYVETALAYLNNKKKPSKKVMNITYLICSVIIFIGALTPMDACWALADITMGGMTIINLPACALLSGTVIKILKDYEKQRHEGRNPVFKAKSIGLEISNLAFWK